MNQKFNVIGMTCSACSARVDKGVRKVPGVREASVNLLTNSMTVDYDETNTDNDKIIRAVADAGYGASLFARGAESGLKSPGSESNLMEDQMRNMKMRLSVSFLFLIPLLYFAMGEMLGLPLPPVLMGMENAVNIGFLQLLLTLPIIYVNRTYYQRGFKALVHRAPNMDSLIAIGSAAAVAYGVFAIFQIGYGMGHNLPELVHQYMMDLYFESAGTILTLITLGKFLETRSKGKTTDAISKLMNLAPKTATVLRDLQEKEIPVGDVVVGDLVLVRPGQSIPVDGVIVEGSSSVDQSALTGESIPVEKQPGDKVIAASINKVGFFKFRAQKVGSDTTLAKIIELVDEASSSKAPIAKLADKVSGIFVPVVIAIAVAATGIWLLLGQPFSFALSIGIAVLVISCPCALGLATPVAIMVGTGKGASNGILIKSGEALETAHTVKTVVLDKTGTVTEGKPRVTDVVPADQVDDRTLLEIAACIEKPSEHPLADAIIERAKDDEIELISTESFTSVPGRGVVAELSGKTYAAGNLSFMEERKIDIDIFGGVSEALAENGKTPLFFADENRLLGVIAVADVVKPTSKAAIEQFKRMGIDVVMLTGDNKRTAEAIRKQLGIDRVVAEVLPQDKESQVRAIQESGKKVAMIGDGINDAPALARADVGIAIGAGTDIAIDSADIVLMKSDLMDAVTAIELSRATIRNIKQNLFWAFFYNSIGIPLAAGVFYYLFGWKLNPMFGAAAMSMSSVCVVLNALRLRFFKPKHANQNQQVNQNINNNNKGELETMKKVVLINGMSCEHCQARVEKALNAIDGVVAKVNLKKNIAVVDLKSEIEDQVLKNAVNGAGYEAVSISDHKGLF